MADKWTSFEVCIKHPGTQGQDDVYSLLEKLLDAGQLQIKETKDWSISQSVLIETVGQDDENFKFDEIGVEDERFFLSLEYIGEGINGDFDEDDEEDVRLLRFTLSEKDENKQLQEVRNGSACTFLEADAPRDQLLHAALKMLHYVNIHSKDDEVNQEAVQNLSHAELVKGKVKLPKIK